MPLCHCQARRSLCGSRRKRATFSCQYRFQSVAVADAGVESQSSRVQPASRRVSIVVTNWTVGEVECEEGTAQKKIPPAASAGSRDLNSLTGHVIFIDR